MIEIITLISFVFHYGILILFGVYNSAEFIGVIKSRKDIKILFILTAVLSVIQILLLYIKGIASVIYAYPLITHLPLFFFFVIYYKQYGRKIVTVVVGIIISYLCCQISNWIGLVAIALGIGDWLNHIIRGIILLLTWYYLHNYFAETIRTLITKPVKSTLIIGIFPAIYYIYDYVSVVYSDLLYSANKATLQFLPFVFCLAFLVFITMYSKEYEHRITAENEAQLHKIQSAQYEFLQSRIEETRRAKHDLRQHLRLIQAYIDKGDQVALEDYIKKYGQSLPDDTKLKYCENDLVNTVLSFYAQQAQAENISFISKFKIPKELNISDPDLCVLLGNLLENAIEECLRHPSEKCKIVASGQFHGSKTLTITVDNFPAFKPKIKDDRLISTKNNGSILGTGTSSIKYIAKKNNGYADFKWKKDTFYASVVLMLK